MATLTNADSAPPAPLQQPVRKVRVFSKLRHGQVGGNAAQVWWIRSNRVVDSHHRTETGDPPRGSHLSSTPPKASEMPSTPGASLMRNLAVAQDLHRDPRVHVESDQQRGAPLAGQVHRPHGHSGPLSPINERPMEVARINRRPQSPFIARPRTIGAHMGKPSSALVYYAEHYVVDILPPSSPRLLSRGRAQRASGVSD